MRSLITGAAGFVGRHLARHLTECGHTVGGLVHPTERDEDLTPYGVGEVACVDLLDDAGLREAVTRFAPDAAFHLAAFSNPESSLKFARKTLETNVLGTQNLLDALSACGEPRVLLVGSAQQYGQVDEDDQPIAETCEQAPLTPYAVSKASQELLGRRYFLSEGLPVFCTRSFNHTGPGQADAYVCSSFARQVAEVEKGIRDPQIRVGNLKARRDFTDVRDVARAYRSIVDNGTRGRAYNVCRGEAVSIQEALETLVDLSSADVEVTVDPERYHALDAPLIVGDPSLLHRDTGFTPEYSFRQTLSDLLDDWRHKI